MLLAVLGAGGQGAPVTAVTALPPPDTTAFGATGQLPDPTPPPLPDAAPSAGAGLGVPDVVGSGLGIPETVLAAYRSAATTVDRSAPGCHLTWPLVAGIGKIESGHASGGAVDADGTTLRPILGPELTGTGGNAAIRDTDVGALDHDAVWDRAVGPTQFIPSSWRTYGADGNGDGRADPDNVFDSGLATARYLCAGGGDLASAAGRHDAVFRYNHSETYVATVLRWADAYASGALPVPDSTGPTATGGTLAEGAPTLAALPEPPTAGGSAPARPAPSGVPTAGGLVRGTPVPAASTAGPASATPSVAAPVITSSGATRPSTGPTRSPGVDLAAPASTLPLSGAPSSGPAGSVAAATGSAPPSSAPSSSTPASGGSASTSGTTSPVKSVPSAPVPSAGAPSVGHPSPSGTTTPSTPATTTPPSSTIPSSSTTPPSSTVPPSSTTSPASTTPTPAARCTAAVPVVATALGVPAVRLTASGEAAPGAGQTTCTLGGPQGPVLVAVMAASGAPMPPAPATGVSRTVERTVLTVPPTAGVPPEKARTALATITSAWF